MKINGLRYKLIITAVLIGVVIILAVFSFPCVIRTVTGVKCLGCGMTRAVISALRLDFKAAYGYHKMFWSLPILYLCFLKDGRLFSWRWANIVFYTLILCGFLVNYFTSTVF